MAGVLDGPAARVLDAKVSSDHSDDELQEPPMVLLDGDALQLEGTLKVATFGREGAEPAHDEDDDTEDGEHEQVLAAGVDESGATVKDSDDSDAEYQEVLDDGSPSGRKAQGLRDTIRQQSLLAKIEQFVGFAQVFSLLQHPVVRLVDRHGQSKWPLEFRQWVTDWMGHFLHALAPDPSFLFPHIDPNYKRLMRVYGAFCFPFFVWIILLAFWQFRRFSWRAAFAFANRLTLVGAARTTILYIALWGVAAGLSMIVLQRAGIAQGEDLLYACQAVLFFFWILHMLLIAVSRYIVADRTRFVRPSMVAKQVSQCKASLCMCILLVTYLPVSAHILQTLQPIFRQSWEERGHRGMSCYLRSFEPVEHSVAYRDALPALPCLSIQGVITYGVASLLVPVYVIALPLLLLRLVTAARTMLIEQGWLRDYFLYEAQRQEVTKHLGFLPLSLRARFFLRALVRELPPLRDVDAEIAVLRKIDMAEFATAHCSDDNDGSLHATEDVPRVGHNSSVSHGAKKEPVILDSLHRELQLVEATQTSCGIGVFSSAPPAALRSTRGTVARLLSVREHRRQRSLRTQEATRLRSLQRAELTRQRVRKKSERRKRRVQQAVDEINRQPERRDFIQRLHSAEAIVELEWIRGEVMALEALRRLKRALREFGDEHMITAGALPVDVAGPLYLFKAYEYDFYFWKPLELFERLLLCALMLFLDDDQFLQLSCACAVLAIGLAISLKYRPYIDPEQDTTDLVCRAALLLVAFTALQLHVGEISTDEANLVLWFVLVGAFLALGYLFRMHHAPAAALAYVTAACDAVVTRFLFSMCTDPGLRIIRRWDVALGFWRRPPAPPVWSWEAVESCLSLYRTILRSVRVVLRFLWIVPSSSPAPATWPAMIGVGVDCRPGRVGVNAVSRVSVPPWILRLHTPGRHLLLKWDARLAVLRQGWRRWSRQPSVLSLTRWAAYRSLRLGHVRYGAGVTLLHVAMAKPEVKLARWLIHYDVRGTLRRARDLDGHTALAAAFEEISMLLRDIETEVDAQRLRELCTRRGRFAQLLLSSELATWSLSWGEHDFGRLGVLAQDVAFACAKAPAHARCRVGQWRKHPHAVQALLATLYLGTHDAALLGNDFLGPILGMHFALALQSNRSAVSLELPRSNLLPQATKGAAMALGGPPSDTCALTAIDLSGNSIGVDAAKAVAKAMKRSSKLRFIDLSYNNIGPVGGRAVAAALRRWDNCVECVRLAGNQLGFDGGAAVGVSIKRRGSTVRAIDIANNNIGSEGAASIASALWKRSALITSLNIEGNQLGEEGGKAFAMALKKNKHLVALWIGRNQLGPDVGITLAKALRINTALTFLDLRENQLGNVFCALLSSIVRQNRSWTSLGLAANNFSGDATVALTEALSASHSLTSVDVSSNVLAPGTAAHLAALVGSTVGARSSALTSLNLAHCIGTDASSTSPTAPSTLEFAQALNSNCALTSLSFTECTLGPMAGHALGLALKRPASCMRVVRLRGCEIGVEGGKSIAAAVETHPSLLVLDLEGNKLGPVGIAAVAGAVASNASVTSLNLSDNNAGSEGGVAVAGALVMNSTLTSLAFRRNAVGTAAASAIAAEIELNRALVFLDLEENHLGPWFGRRLADSLHTNAVLSTLMLGRNELGHEKREAQNAAVRLPPVLAGRALAAVLQRTSSAITHLDLGTNRLGPRAGVAIASMLEAEGCVVSTLLLPHNLLGPEAGERLAKSMLRNSLVTALDLGHNAIGTEAGVVLAEVIKRSISLTSLNLEHNELGPRAGVPVLRALQENVSLTALDLASNAIGPKCTPLLSAVFSQNNASESVLRHADLSNNDLGADSFAAAVTLAHAVGSNRSLVYLKLDCNRLGRHAGVAFASALHTNRTLEILSLADNRFDAEVGFAFLGAVAQNKIISTLHVNEVEVGREAFHDVQKRLEKRVSRQRGKVI